MGNIFKSVTGAASSDAEGIATLTTRTEGDKKYQFVKKAAGIYINSVGESLYDSTTLGEVTTTPAKNTFRGIALVASATSTGTYLWCQTKGYNSSIKKVGATTVGGQIKGSITSVGVVFTAAASTALTGRLLGYWTTSTSAGVTNSPGYLY